MVNSLIHPSISPWSLVGTCCWRRFILWQHVNNFFSIHQTRETFQCGPKQCGDWLTEMFAVFNQPESMGEQMIGELSRSLLNWGESCHVRVAVASFLPGCLGTARSWLTGTTRRPASVWLVSADPSPSPTWGALSSPLQPLLKVEGRCSPAQLSLSCSCLKPLASIPSSGLWSSPPVPASPCVSRRLYSRTVMMLGISDTVSCPFKDAVNGQTMVWFRPVKHVYSVTHGWAVAPPDLDSSRLLYWAGCLSPANTRTQASVVIRAELLWGERLTDVLSEFSFWNISVLWDGICWQRRCGQCVYSLWH